MSQNESPAAGAEAAPDKATFIAKKTTAGILALLLGGLGVQNSTSASPHRGSSCALCLLLAEY